MGSDRHVAANGQSWFWRILRGLLSAAGYPAHGAALLETVVAAGREFAGGGHPQDIAQRLAALVATRTCFTRVQVLLVNEAQQLESVQRANLPAWAEAEVGRALLHPETSPWHAVWRQGQPSISAEMVHLPLRAGDLVLGVLTVYPETWPVQAEELQLLEALASQAAGCLHRTQLQAENGRQQARLTRVAQCLQGLTMRLGAYENDANRAVAAVVEAAARLLAPATVLVHTREGVQWQEAVSATPAGAELVGGPHVLSLSLVSDGQQIGHLEVYLHGEQRRPEAEELAVLHLLAHLVTFAQGGTDLAQRAGQGAGGQVQQAYMSTLEALSKALEMRDYETEGHSRRVVQYTLGLARQLGVPEAQMTGLMRGALLHDIGKIGIPDAVLRKPGPLNEEEWSIMKEHPRIGYNLLHQIDFLAEAMPIIMHHHERYDGSGYPLGLQADAIPLGARIFAVADAYDAITSDRPYRKGRPHREAVDEIVRCAGNHFDPSVVHALITMDPEEFAAIRGGKLLSLR